MDNIWFASAVWIGLALLAAVLQRSRRFRSFLDRYGKGIRGVRGKQTFSVTTTPALGRRGRSHSVSLIASRRPDR